MMLQLVFAASFYEEGSDIRELMFKPGAVPFEPKLNKMFLNMSLDYIRAKHGWTNVTEPDMGDIPPEKEPDYKEEAPAEPGKDEEKPTAPGTYDLRADRPFCYPKGKTPFFTDFCLQATMMQAVSYLEQYLCMLRNYSQEYSTYYPCECDSSMPWCSYRYPLELAYRALTNVGTTSLDCYIHQGDQYPCPEMCDRYIGMEVPKTRFKHYQTFNSEQNMQAAIPKGPLVAYMTLYEDFFFYGRGVYYHTSGMKVGTTPVLIVGWGYTNEIKTWYCRTAYGSDFGYEDGYIYVYRGHDECGIESLSYYGYL